MEQSQQVSHPQSINFLGSESFENDEFHRKYEEMDIIGEGGAAVVKKCKCK